MIWIYIVWYFSGFLGGYWISRIVKVKYIDVRDLLVCAILSALSGPFYLIALYIAYQDRKWLKRKIWQFKEKEVKDGEK